MEHGAGPPYSEDDGDEYEYEDEPGQWAQDAEPETSELPPPVQDAPAPLSETVVLSARLQAIVETAERSAEDVRLAAEQRADDRIAEADRAAAIRVRAAEEEAAEIIAEAHAKAAGLAAEAVNTVDSIHAEAHTALREANERAKETIEQARNDAREIVRAAHVATSEVMDDGSELSEQLRELSSSLRTNAERLIRDIRLAHGSMTARLDQALPRGMSVERDESPSPSRRRVRPADPDAAVDFEVPDFVLRDE